MSPDVLAAVERISDDLPKVGEPEFQFSTVSTADLRAVLAALAQQSPGREAACWSQGFAAGEAWRRSVQEFREAGDYGPTPAEPANPYKTKEPTR